MGTMAVSPPPAADHYEMVRGELVELPDMSLYAGWVATRLVVVLGTWLERNPLGQVLAECLFVLDAERGLRRRPDVAFLSVDRWPANRPVPPSGDSDVAPDIAVEVLSPNDLANNVAEKRHDYLAHGVREVWIVEPLQRELIAFAADGSVRRFGPEDTLSTPLLPGWSTPMAGLFPPVAR